MVFDAAPALLADVQLPIPGLGGAKAEWWSVLSVGASAGTVGLPVFDRAKNLELGNRSTWVNSA